MINCLSSETVEALAEATQGKVQPETFATLALPTCSTELELLTYFCCRLQPAMPTLQFTDTADLIAKLESHYAWHKYSVRAIVTARTDRALDLMLLLNKSKSDASAEADAEAGIVSPWSYGANYGKRGTN